MMGTAEAAEAAGLASEAQAQEAQGKEAAAVGGEASSEQEKQARTVNLTGPIKHIIVSGNEKHSSEDILKFVTSTKEGAEYDREIVKKDVEAILSSGLVQSARAKALLNNGELYVIFEVEELADVSKVSITGNDLIPTEQLLPLLATKAGDGFSPEAVRQDMETIRRVYEQAGYIAIVSDVNNNAGNVTFNVSEAKVGAVTYSGNKKTKTWVLEKIAGPYLREGALLRNADLQAAYNALAGSGYFSDVKINAADIPGEPGKVSLDVSVKEASTGAWSVGAAMSDTYGFEGLASIYDKNLGGTAKSINLDLGIGKERDHYTLTFTDPYWKKSNTSVYAQAFKNDKNVDNDYYEYTEEHTGGEIGFSKPVSHDGKTTMYANYRLDKVEVSEQEKGEELSSFQEGSVTLGVTHNNVNPSTGSGSVYDASVTAAQEFLGSDEDFTKFMLRVKGYKRLSNRDMLAARGEFHYSPDDLPGIEEFTMGGSDTVRGMEEGEQRGNKSVLGSVELRHDFTDKFQGVVFADVGKAWKDEVENDLRTAVGLGVRVKTALGILRLDAAKVDGQSVKFLFGIGNSF